MLPRDGCFSSSFDEKVYLKPVLLCFGSFARGEFEVVDEDFEVFLEFFDIFFDVAAVVAKAPRKFDGDYFGGYLNGFCERLRAAETVEKRHRFSH